MNEASLFFIKRSIKFHLVVFFSKFIHVLKSDGDVVSFISWSSKAVEQRRKLFLTSSCQSRLYSTNFISKDHKEVSLSSKIYNAQCWQGLQL